jgi:hypothetical protein
MTRLDGANVGADVCQQDFEGTGQQDGKAKHHPTTPATGDEADIDADASSSTLSVGSDADAADATTQALEARAHGLEEQPTT